MEAVHAFHHLDPVRNTQLVADVRHLRALHVRVTGGHVTAEVLLLGEHGVEGIYAAFVSRFVVTVRTSLERVVGLWLRRKMHMKVWDRLAAFHFFIFSHFVQRGQLAADVTSKSLLQGQNLSVLVLRVKHLEDFSFVGHRE